MKTQTRDALFGIFDSICLQQADLNRRVRTMESLLSQHSQPVYQEYMDKVVAAATNPLPDNTRKVLEVFRQTLLQDRD